ncbi:hypothetical protein ASPZODRAFT_133443 [Penicilliopsis zonata CBS 506.65]|uniref:Uncharacterized protein n=1 Tax=Penicilliopsis zonata CBS 506.65 TaxID=1073090 RepID=A0A1L9SEZ7_9EURO|nr:hypothetical protein ASPZODRAFT_133443 [Penicilliopsis zonata CBS 506.65]OJJ45594.1 hypothetical protein ASPZODRAFT_133443 [Penicilliopsis zonata CBS 506.65]
MGQRHNRRKTRPRSRNSSIQQLDLNHRAESIPSPCAPSWHLQGLSGWQPAEEPVSLRLRVEAEQCRLFGGEPGDDVGLCYRMLEYFGRLDYIDSLGYLGD